MSPLINEGTDLAMSFGLTSGQMLVQTPSPLTRLNYFDGKFLRAEDLRREQDYVRQLVQFSNQGLGAGVVYGMDTVLDSQGRVSIGPGLAMDSTGRTLLVQSAAAFDIGMLIDATRRIRQTNGRATTNGNADFGGCVDATSAPGDVPTQGGSLYVICIGHAESLCGQEDVYGRLCEEACITATDRPLIVEGVVVRALPLTLHTALASSRTVALDRRHMRSLVASAYFEDERKVVACLISRAGLALDTWCVGAELSGVCCVPLAVVARAGSQTIFLDAWTARRERMEAPARRYWAWRMCMRPWDAYLAQILQFQCQLHEVLGDGGDPGSEDPCAPQRGVLDEASKYLRDFDETYTRHISALARITDVPANLRNSDALFQLQGGAADLTRLRQQIDGALRGMIGGAKSRVLINGGIVELPPAGYLPVVPGTVSVNTQVRRLLGEGLDLRFCVVRPDFVAHALEECQHMERISLLTGLDDPKAKQEVDILVPYGEIGATDVQKLAGFDTQVRLTGTGAAALVATSGSGVTGSGSGSGSGGGTGGGGTAGGTGTGGSGGGVTLIGGVASGGGSGTSGLNRSESNAATTNANGRVLHGAGRGELLPSGGGAFYFAGVQEAAAAQQIIDTVHAIRTINAAAPQARVEMINRLASSISAAPAFSRVEMLDGATVARFAASGASARESRAFAAVGNSTASPSIGTPAPPSGIATPAAPGAVAVMPTQVSMWSAVRSERDPFAMTTADTTAMSFELVLSSEPGSNSQTPIHALLRLRILGSFTVTQMPVTTTAGERMTGHFSGSYTVQALIDNNETHNGSPSLEVDVSIQRGGTIDAGTIKVKFGSETSRIVLLAEGSWGGQPLEATLKLSVGAGSNTVGDSIANLGTSSPYAKLMELLSMSAIASDDALTEGSALRMLSTSGLELIGQEMTRANQGGTAYVDAAMRQLFPPAPPPVDDLTVRATLDWVLFHRRRTKRCATPVERPPVTPPRRYQLYEYRAEGPRDLVIIRQLLRTPAAITRLPFKRVDVVEFSGGLSTLLTAPDALLRDWGASQPGNTLIYGAIATSVAADAPLSSPRLTRVAEGVAATSAIGAANSLFETIPDVPTALAVPGTDGMIFLVTINVVKTTCHDAYRVALDANALRLIDANNLAALVLAPETKHLSSVDFSEGSNAPAAADSASLVQAWAAGGGGTVDRVLVYHNPSDSSAGDVATNHARAQALSTALGGTANAPVLDRVAASLWPQGPTCPVITLIVAQSVRTVRVVAFRTGAIGAVNNVRIALANDVVRFVNGALVADANFQTLLQELRALLTLGPVLSHVATVDLAIGGLVDAEDTVRMNALVSALEAGNQAVIDPLRLTRPPFPRITTTAERPMLAENNQTVNDLLVLTVFQLINL